MNKAVYIVILNWNGWRDTIECLESVFRLDYDNYKVIICDNDSNDNSLANIKQWAKGKVKANTARHRSLKHLASPEVNKPISFVEYNRNQAEAGGKTGEEDAKLILIQTGGNLGFSGGNNVGLRYALTRNDFDYIWLLNNDTVVERECLKRMVAHVQNSDEPCACGSKILFYDEPETIQALGGASYNKWTGLAKSLGLNLPVNEPVNPKNAEKKLGYVLGASNLLPKEFLTEIGLLSEDYFLYYEEIDLYTRAKGKFKASYCDDAIVYHKEGKSIGSASDKRKTSNFSDFYLFKSKLLFTKKFYPEALTTIYITTFLQALNRIRRGQFKKAYVILRILLGQREFNPAWR